MALLKIKFASRKLTLLSDLIFLGNHSERFLRNITGKTKAYNEKSKNFLKNI